MDPVLDGEPEAKKQKVDSEDLGNSIVTMTDERSEDDWEEVDRFEGGPTERLDDEPVEIGRAPSAADVHSVQSSGILGADETRLASSLLEKDW